MARWSVVPLLLGVLLGMSAQAATFPERALTMVIGYAAGGSTDVQGRVLAEVLAERLGQPVRVSNIPGAGGAVAAAMLANSREQGYVFQYGISSTISISPLLAPASYDLDSFTYVAGLSLDQSAYVTSGQSGFKTWPELLQYLRDNPGQVYVTQTAEDRLLTRAIAKREGLQLRIMPTSGGAGMAPLVNSGEVVFAYSGGTHTAYTDSGQMRVLASLAQERLMGYPEAPTLRELGYDLALHAVRIVSVPADTPVEQVQILAAALQSAVADPRFIEVTEQRIRQPIHYMSGAEVKAKLSQQVQEYRQLIEEIGLQ